MTQHTSSHITRNLLLGAGAALIAGAGAVYTAANWLFGFALDSGTKHSMLVNPPKDADKVNAAEPVHADAVEETEAARWFEESRQPVWLTADDGTKLHGWLFDPDCVDPRPHLYAICCHGFSGGPQEMAKYAHRYARMGFTVLVPASRCHELSEGRYVGMGWLERLDLLDWIGLIVESDPQARILLHGNSMGAATVMMTVGEPTLPRNVVAAIEDCGYTSVWDQYLYNAKTLYNMPRWLARPVVACMSRIAKKRAGFDFREASSVKQLRHATVPMLFIHGGADDFVDPSFVDRNYDACASLDRQKLIIPGAGHTMSASTAPAVYWRTVEHFVRRVFAI